VIDVFPFAGFTVAVLGLGPDGRMAARSLGLSEAEVWAWDDDEANREVAEAEEIQLTDLNGIDWREPVSLVIEHGIPHGKSSMHPLVAKAREAGCEVISDVELLARAQRDAGYLAVVSHASEAEALDILEYVFEVSGREIEVAGGADEPVLSCHPLEAGGTYILAMPPSRADITVSVTFDQVLFLGMGEGAWPPFSDTEESRTAARWLFHRQTAPKGAVVNIDDAAGRAFFDALAAEGEQVLIPLSITSPVAGGIYVESGWLIDDRKGDAIRVVQLPVAGNPAAMLLAAGAYATAVLAGIAEHAAMASMMSFFAE